jgi:PncC family amidohydrolase
MSATLAREVGRLLREHGLTLSVAESCTGGRLGDALTNVSGSSDYFLGGIISYSNDAKVSLLGVRRATLAKVGAVSAEVAKQMATGVRRRLRTSIGVGITGVAGPTGGTKAKPVGLVYIAVSSGKKTAVSKNLFTGNRSQVKSQTVARALQMVAEFLEREF